MPCSPPGVRRRWRRLAAVPGSELPFRGRVDQREAAADSRGLGLDHVQREQGRDRRIDRVAAGFQDLVPGARRERVRRDDHEPGGVDGLRLGAPGRRLGDRVVLLRQAPPCGEERRQDQDRDARPAHDQ